MVKIIRPFAGTAQEQEEEEPMSEENLLALHQYVGIQLAPVQGAVERLYALIRELTPEKKFLEAVDRLNKAAQEAARAPRDPRLDELQAEVQSLKDGLPRAIAQSLKELVGDMKNTIQQELRQMAPLTPPKDKEQTEDLDWGASDAQC